MLQPGDKVPDFTLACGYPDGRRDLVHFGSLLGKGPIVLEFFPLAFTRVCTTQMCDIRDHMGAFEALDARVFGFSCDSAPANAAFAQSLNLPHGILSDPNREVVDRLWATQDVVGVNRVPKRGWMVVSPEGLVADLFVADQPGVPWVGVAPVEAAIQKMRQGA